MPNLAGTHTTYAKPIDHASHVVATRPTEHPLGVSANLTQPAAKGPQHIVVVLVEFPDRAHSISADKVRGVLDEMDRFYRDASYGMISIVGTVTDRWYRVQTPLSQLKSIEQWHYNYEEMKSPSMS